MKWGQDQAFVEFQPTLSEVEETVLSMFSRDDQRIFVRLLGEAKSRIFSDYKKAKGKLKAFCLTLMRGLIDSDLKIGKTLEANGLGHSYCYEFRRLTGMTPRAYLEHHRLTLGQSILRHIDPHIYIAAYAAGYSGLSPFSRAYSRRMGYPPSEEPNAEPDETRALVGGMPYDLISSTCRPDPRVSTNTAEETIAHPTGQDMKTFWEEASGMSRSDLRGYMYRHANVISVEHFYFLIEKAKYEGRIDRKRGVELAHSALDALSLEEFWNGKLHTDERAFGCAVIGNHYRLSFELQESEQWFQEAMRLLPANPEGNPLLFAKVNYLKAALLWWQHRVGEAIKLSNVVLPIIREHGSAELLARTLQLKGEIYLSAGYLGRAIPHFSAAIDLSRAIDDPYVVFSAHFNLTYLYTRMSRPAEATAQYEEVKRLRSTVELSTSHLAWLEGAVHATNEQYSIAESAYLEAREGFIAQGLELYAALSSLELSYIYMEQGKVQKAFSTAISTIPAISRYSCHKEAISALAILQETSRTQDIEKAAIKEVLNHLEQVRKDPTAAFLSRCQS